ncbi:unnamed protein product [Phaedon cochleariae]|uniref:Uncharacterized protein n=1 Tax=Phaedon cochleariae TaxID=80249 RepID=A0A9N9SBB1_PHACE|nr:unnamed protein product [Phaedon cochleariae]
MVIRSPCANNWSYQYTYRHCLLNTFGCAISTEWESCLMDRKLIFRNPFNLMELVICIHCLQSIADIQPNLVYKRNKYSQLKLTMQPIPILVGQSILNIEKSFVSVNDSLWEMESPLKAIDLCFKCFYAFNGHLCNNHFMKFLLIMMRYTELLITLFIYIYIEILNTRCPNKITVSKREYFSYIAYEEKHILERNQWS